MRSALVLALGLVVACSGAAPSQPSTAPVLAIQLTDVRTGERFTLGGFPGKTVIVEGMAVW